MYVTLISFERWFDPGAVSCFLHSITLGGFGADRFYLGQWREGLGKLFSFGGLGIWTLIDVLLIAVGYVGPADGSLYIWDGTGRYTERSLVLFFSFLQKRGHFTLDWRTQKANAQVRSSSSWLLGSSWFSHHSLGYRKILPHARRK